MKVTNPGKKDLEQLVILENETFPTAEAASRAEIKNAQRDFLGAEKKWKNNCRHKWHDY